MPCIGSLQRFSPCPLRPACGKELQRRTQAMLRRKDDYMMMQRSVQAKELPLLAISNIKISIVAKAVNRLFFAHLMYAFRK